MTRETTAYLALIATSTIIAVLVLFLSPHAKGAIEHRDFVDETQRELYYDVIRELRCLVCQNQNLAESDADLAKDLRNKTYELIEQGKDRSAIVDFMVERYGDFVLYRPPFKLSTAALWLGPLCLLVIGVLVFFRITRASSSKEMPSTTTLVTTDPSSQLSSVDVNVARQLLNNLANDDLSGTHQDSNNNGAQDR